MRGGGNLHIIIGVVCAPAAIINFAFFVRELLAESYRDSQIFTGVWREIIATVARTTPIIEISPLTKTPFRKPLTITSVQRTRSNLASHSAVPCGTNVKRTNANRAIPIATQQTQGL